MPSISFFPPSDFSTETVRTRTVKVPQELVESVEGTSKKKSEVQRHQGGMVLSGGGMCALRRSLAVLSRPQPRALFPSQLLRHAATNTSSSSSSSPAAAAKLLNAKRYRSVSGWEDVLREVRGDMSVQEVLTALIQLGSLRQTRLASFDTRQVVQHPQFQKLLGALQRSLDSVGTAVANVLVAFSDLQLDYSPEVEAKIKAVIESEVANFAPVGLFCCFAMCPNLEKPLEAKLVKHMMRMTVHTRPNEVPLWVLCKCLQAMCERDLHDAGLLTMLVKAITPHVQEDCGPAEAAIIFKTIAKFEFWDEALIKNLEYLSCRRRVVFKPEELAEVMHAASVIGIMSPTFYANVKRITLKLLWRFSPRDMTLVLQCLVNLDAIDPSYLKLLAAHFLKMQAVQHTASTIYRSLTAFHALNFRQEERGPGLYTRFVELVSSNGEDFTAEQLTQMKAILLQRLPNLNAAFIDALIEAKQKPTAATAEAGWNDPTAARSK
eukprot:g80069.t1